MPVVTTEAGPAHRKRVLIIVENLPVPFDRRVWSEARTLKAAGYEVSVICPVGRNATARHEVLEGIDIYRHPMPAEARGALGYLIEYGAALFWEFLLACRIFFGKGFDAIHACNPPDLIFLVGGFFKYVFGTKFVFDQHDINPELYEAKFGKRDAFWRLLLGAERATFRLADISIATNMSYRAIAIERGRMDPDRVFVVRSGPDLARVKPVPPDPTFRNGRAFMVGYVGVIGAQEGIDLLLQAVQHIVSTRGRADVQTVIVGGGSDVEVLKAMSVDMGLKDFVTFTGRVDDQTLMAALSTADVCVNPDRPNEMNDKSTMNKIMEYMALGKPIVQFDLTEGRFSAQTASLYAKNNDVVDFGDKILALLDEPDTRASMGQFGQARVRDELSWDHERGRLLAAYDALFESAAH